MDRASAVWRSRAAVPAVFLLAAAATAAVLAVRRDRSASPPGARAGSTGAASSLALPATSSAPEPTNPTGILVWAGQAGDDPHEQAFESVHTVWLTTGDAGFEAAGTMPGVVLLHRGKAWRWSPTQKDMDPCVCGDAAVAGKGKSVGAELVAIGHDERVPVVVPPEFCNADGPDASVTLLGSVGPLLFVRTDHYEFGCGAHGIAVPRFLVWSMETGGPVDLLHEVDTANARKTAHHQLAPPSTSGSAEPVPGVADVELVTLQPSYDDNGKLTLLGGFKTWACHACTGTTSFVWGQYSRGVLVPLEVPPAPLERFVRAPELLRSYVVKYPDRVVGGWSSPEPGTAIPEILRAELGKAPP